MLCDTGYSDAVSLPNGIKIIGKAHTGDENFKQKKRYI